MEFEIFTKPLSVNKYYATSGRSIYVTAKGKQYKLGIINGLKESNITKLEGDLKLDIQLKLTKRYKMDVDNCLKPLLDSF